MRLQHHNTALQKLFVRVLCSLQAEKIVQSVLEKKGEVQVKRCKIESSSHPDIDHQLPTQTLHSIRYNKTNYTWSHNFDILTQTGHKWCSILRDNHACFGDNYAAILNITTPYQGHRYNLLSFEAKHERILAVSYTHLTLPTTPYV